MCVAEKKEETFFKYQTLSLGLERTWKGKTLTWHQKLKTCRDTLML